MSIHLPGYLSVDDLGGRADLSPKPVGSVSQVDREAWFALGMGLFKWKRTEVSGDEHEQPVFSELTPEYEQFLAAYVDIAEGSGVNLEDPESVADFYEAALATWQASEGQMDAELYGNAAGVALGELLVRISPLRWVVAEDSKGRELAVHSERNNFLVYPLDAVEKRWARSEDGVFIRAFASRVIDHFKVN
ncbi:DUF3806 domain-containing protein [Paenarthrobacter sp. NPDC090520]|uniref:DUF3806 domain-containing protein n=1 Tax=Paenarthrobacter sp. NPDC090520 TaxID=3364382 RepID=UPI00382380C7